MERQSSMQTFSDFPFRLGTVFTIPVGYSEEYGLVLSWLTIVDQGAADTDWIQVHDGRQLRYIPKEDLLIMVGSGEARFLTGGDDEELLSCC